MTQPLTSDQARDLLRRNPSAYATRDELRALAAQVDADASGRLTVLYSGPAANGISSNDFIQAMMEAGEDVRVINKTQAAEFLTSREFYGALAKIEGLPGISPLIDGSYRGPATDRLYHSENGPWADASARFADATVGEVRVVASNAVANKVFSETEVPRILANERVSTIEGVSRLDYVALQQREGNTAVFEAILSRARERTGELHVAVNYAGTPLRADTGRFMVDSRAFMVGSEVQGKIPNFTIVSRPLADSMDPPNQHVLAGGRHQLPQSGPVQQLRASVDGVSSYPASAEQLATYPAAQAELDRFKPNMPTFLHADNPHERLFVANFDGTGNDKFDPNKPATNVAQIHDQLDYARAAGESRIHAEYLPGPGTQENKIVRGLDLGLGYTSPDRVEKMYANFVSKSNEWASVDPEVQIRTLTLGFSRGGSQGSAFTNLVHDRGIPDLTSKAINPDGSLSYGRYLAPPGQVRQALGLFDPVATGGPMHMDREPPKSVERIYQLTAIDEHRAKFPSDRTVPMGSVSDGRSLNSWVAGAHSDIGGGYHQNAIAIRNGNLMKEFCNGLCERPLLQMRAVPEVPDLSVIHRSVEGLPIYKLDGQVSRLTPAGVNTELKAVIADPRLVRTSLNLGGTALGVGATAYDAVSTWKQVEEQKGLDNQIAADSARNHFIGRNAGAWVAGTTAYGLGATGAGPLILLAADGYMLSKAGEKAADLLDNRKIYHQTDREGVSWEFSGRVWTRAGMLDTTKDGKDNPTPSSIAATYEKSLELSYLATNEAAKLAISQAPEPRDPYKLPASEGDLAGLDNQDWVRNPDSGQWSRQVKTGIFGANDRGVYEEQIAPPERAAQLDAQSTQVIKENISNSPQAMAARYEVAYRTHHWEDYGAIPGRVQTALPNPDVLTASDGQVYRRDVAGSWSSNGKVAEGNRLLELENTRSQWQAEIADHNVRLAELQARPTPTPQQMQREETLYRYRSVGTELTPEWQDAIELATHRTREANGLVGKGSQQLQANASREFGADSPIAHFQRGPDGVDRIAAITTTAEIKQALTDVRAQRLANASPVAENPERRIEARTPQQREAYTQALHEANRRGVSAPDAAQIATLAAVQVRAPGREERQEPEVEPELRQERDPIATERPTRAVEPVPQVVEQGTQEPEAKQAEQPQQVAAPTPATPELAGQERAQVAGQPVPMVATTPAPQIDAQQPQEAIQAPQPQPQGQVQDQQPPPVQKVSETPAVEPRQPEPAVANEQPAPDQPGLRLGDRGPDVEFLQHRLQRAGASGPEGQPVPLDGTYGVETQHAVREFQQAQGLPPTGVADQALDEALARAPQVRQEPVARVESEQPVQAAPEQVVERPSPEQREVQAQAVAEAQRHGATPERVQQVAAQAVDQGQTVERRIEVSEPSRAYAGPSMGGGGRSIERDEQQEPTQRQAQSQGFPTDHHDYALFVAIQQQLPKDTPDEKTAEIMHQAKLGGIKHPDQLDEVVVENDRAWVFGKTAGSYSQEVSMGAQAPAMNETLQRNQDFDQQQALQMQQFQEQQARINQNQGGPSMTM